MESIIKPHAYKDRDDYQNEEEILLLVQFPLLLFWGVGQHRVSTSRIGLVPLEPDGERLDTYLERRTPWG